MLILLMSCASNVFAQGNAAIRGVVTDKSTGEPLPGASVFIEGTTLGAATNEEGEYQIPRVSAGSYVLSASYIGYQEVKMDITVAGTDLVVNIAMEFATFEGDEVIVTAQAEGQIAAINQQIQATTIKNVVSAARIQQIPDVNAAESVARLPGISLVRSGGEGQQVAVRGLSPKYNVMMVNGVRMQSTDRDNRSVDLNMIAPNVLSGIEVTKALTADMDADAVGGTVNLKIGKAREGFHSTLSAQGGYGSVGETYGNWRGSGIVSNRFLKNKLGVQLSGYLDNYNRDSDVLSASYAVNEENQLEEGLAQLDLRSTVISDRITDRQRGGAGLIFDYELPKGTLQLNNFISNLSEDQVEIQNSLGLLGNQFNGLAASRSLSNTVISNALQGEYDFSWVTVDFSLSNSISLQSRPGDLQMDIVAEQNQAAFTTTADETATPSEFLNSVDVRDILRISRINTVERDIREAAQDAALNFTVPYNITNNITGNLKVGGKYTFNSRDNDETMFFNQPDRTFQGERFVAAMRESLWVDLGLERIDENLGIRASLFRDPDYDIGNFLTGQEGVDKFFYTPSIDKMLKFERLAKENGAYFLADQQSFERDYDYTRGFSAFYAMTELNVGKHIMLLPGIRYEQYRMDYSAFYTEKYGPNFEDFRNEELNSKSQSETWFPQMQVRVKPTNWLDVRLASTKSIIYPDYRALSPFVYYNTFSGNPFMSLGNPALKPAVSQNYDIYASIYEDHVGLFTAGVFRKEVDNLITPFSFRTKESERINNRVELPTNVTTTVDTWINLDEPTTVEGFELEWQTNFWYGPSILRGLVFNVNYTHIRSDTDYPFQLLVRLSPGPFGRTELVDTTRAGRMPDQPSDIFNATLGYDFKGFSARVSFLYQDNVLGNPGIRAELDSYTDALYRWDVILYQRLPWRGFKAYVNLNNITNSSDRQFVSVLGKLSSANYYGRTADIGIRYEF
ncbi:MAG: TonB-dependent receptor [Rhodothermales bacterium]